MGVRAVRHTGIVVSEMEASLRFYRDLLGLEVRIDQVEEGAFIEALLARPGTRVRTVKLAAPEGPTLVELLEFERPEGAPPPLDRVGPTHAALTVDDLDGLHRRLSAAGGRFLSDPLVSADGAARVAFCRDPDGTLLELVEPR